MGYTMKEENAKPAELFELIEIMLERKEYMVMR
jgi:hypothetical protein